MTNLEGPWGATLPEALASAAQQIVGQTFSVRSTGLEDPAYVGRTVTIEIAGGLTAEGVVDTAKDGMLYGTITSVYATPPPTRDWDDYEDDDE